VSSLALYRQLVPAHRDIASEVVETYLDVAASLHTASAFGDAYSLAMVYFAAHLVERTPSVGSGGADEARPT
jgi:hypothetical protein